MDKTEKTAGGLTAPAPSGKEAKASACRAKKAGPGGHQLAAGASPEGRRKAAVVLEVLAGERTPGQAASALGIGLPRYYLWEQRALAGLVQGCEPKEQKGRVRSPTREIEVLRRENAVLKREAARQQALVRLAQRAIGLSQAAGQAKGGQEQGPGRKRRRRPVVRALKAARVLQEVPAATAEGSDERGEGDGGPTGAGAGAGG